MVKPIPGNNVKTLVRADKEFRGLGDSGRKVETFRLIMTGFKSPTSGL